MSVAYDNADSLPTRVEYLRLPDMVPLPDKYAIPMRLKPGTASYMAPGFYDGAGKKLGELSQTVPSAKVVVEFAGVTFIWAVFAEPLLAGQTGSMIFENLPGTAPITPFFGEWDLLISEPRIGSARFSLVAAQRGRNIAKVVGRNDGDADLTTAAGFIISLGVLMPAEYNLTPPGVMGGASATKEVHHG